MADPIVADGLYWIVSADEPANAMDVRGGSDLSGATVQYWERNGSDAQLVSVRNVTQEGVSGVTLLFPLCGRYVDVMDGGTVALHDGQGVQTYDGNGSRAQVFRPIAQGRTVTVDGEALTVYKLRSMALNGTSTNYCLDGSGTSSSGGTVIWVWHEYSGGAQNWVFVPVANPPFGVYRLRPSSNTELCLGVYSESRQAGANVQLVGESDSNSQRFSVHEGLAGDSLVAIACAQTGLYLDVQDGDVADNVKNGQNVQVFTGNGSDAQQWALIPSGTADVGGVATDAYEVAPKTSTGYRLDAGGGGDTPEDNVQVWERNGSVFQRFALTPDEAEATDVAAPRAVGLRSKLGGDLGKVAWTRRPTQLYPRWRCAGDAFKVRFRRRYRSAGGGWGGWSRWAGTRLGSTANEGWDDMWRPSEVSEGSGEHVSAHPIEATVDNVAHDACQVEVEVRRFLSAWGVVEGQEGPAHSASGSGVTTVSWMPSLVLTQVGFGPQGLVVGYETDSRRDGHAIELRTSVSRAVTLRDAPRKGSVLVPVESLYELPSDGQEIRVWARLTSCDGLTREYELAGTVRYDSGSGMGLQTSYRLDRARAAYTLRVVERAGSPNLRAYLLVDDALGGSRFVECPWAADGDDWTEYRVLPAFGRPAHVFVFDRSDDGRRWAVRDDVLDAIEDDRFVWNFGAYAEGFLAIRAGLGAPPSSARSLEPDSERKTTTGRDFPVVGFGRSVAARCDVSGVLWRDLPDALRAARMLASCGRAGHYAFHRGPDGFWAQVAVTGVDMPLERAGRVEVSVAQEVIG